MKRNKKKHAKSTTKLLLPPPKYNAYVLGASPFIENGHLLRVADIQVKSNFIIRTSQDLKESRVEAYQYLL